MTTERLKVRMKCNMINTFHGWSVKSFFNDKNTHQNRIGKIGGGLCIDPLFKDQCGRRPQA